MHTEPKMLLKEAILTSIPILRPLVGQFAEEYQVLRRANDSQWHAVSEKRPDIGPIFKKVSDQLETIAIAFGSSFLEHHPEYAGLVGFRCSQGNWGNKKASHLLDSALRRLWWQYKSFDLGESEVSGIVKEFSDFVDNPTVRLRYFAQIMNFSMPGSELNFPNSLRIRRLNEEEISALHGGSRRTLGMFRPLFSSIHEFVIEGELEETKILGNNHPEGQSMGQRAKAVLDKAILALRTYMEGHVGYDYVHFRPLTYCPIGFFTQQGCGTLYIPLGSYRLAESDLIPLLNHASLIFPSSDRSMDMACARLADAECRVRAEDSAVDAVIGMESILLAGLGKDERRGELSYRFSMRYSTLFKTPEERYRHYRIARDLYSLRSTIAHGNEVGQVHRIGDEKLNLEQAARQAKTALRHLIHYFLTRANLASYKRPEFWDRALFGLPDES